MWVQAQVGIGINKNNLQGKHRTTSLVCIDGYGRLSKYDANEVWRKSQYVHGYQYGGEWHNKRTKTKLIQLLNIDWTGLIQPKPAHISIDLVRPGNAANTTLDILHAYEYVAIVFGLLCISKEMLLQVIM